MTGSGGPIVLARNTREAEITIRSLHLEDALPVDARQGVGQLDGHDLGGRELLLVQGWWLGPRHHEIARWLNTHDVPIDRGAIIVLEPVSP